MGGGCQLCNSQTSKRIANIEHLLPVKIAVVLVTTSCNSDSDRQNMFHFCKPFRSLVTARRVMVLDLFLKTTTTTTTRKVTLEKIVIARWIAVPSLDSIALP